MTKKQNKQAQEILGKFTELDGLWMNPKGEFFTPDNKDLALNSLKGNDELEWIGRELSEAYERLKNAAEKVKEQDPNMTSEEPVIDSILVGSIESVKDAAQSIESVEQLEKLLEEETSNANRKGAKEVLAARIEELKTNQSNG